MPRPPGRRSRSASRPARRSLRGPRNPGRPQRPGRRENREGREARESRRRAGEASKKAAPAKAAPPKAAAPKAAPPAKARASATRAAEPVARPRPVPPSVGAQTLSLPAGLASEVKGTLAEWGAGREDGAALEGRRLALDRQGRGPVGGLAPARGAAAGASRGVRPRGRGRPARRVRSRRRPGHGRVEPVPGRLRPDLRPAPGIPAAPGARLHRARPDPRARAGDRPPPHALHRGLQVRDDARARGPPRLFPRSGEEPPGNRRREPLRRDHRPRHRPGAAGAARGLPEGLPRRSQRGGALLRPFPLRDGPGRRHGRERAAPPRPGGPDGRRLRGRSPRRREPGPRPRGRPGCSGARRSRQAHPDRLAPAGRAGRLGGAAGRRVAREAREGRRPGGRRASRRPARHGRRPVLRLRPAGAVGLSGAGPRRDRPREVGSPGRPHRGRRPRRPRPGVLPLGDRHGGRRLHPRRESLRPARRGGGQGGGPPGDGGLRGERLAPARDRVGAGGRAPR